jgi:hypothetical protein
MSIKILKKKEPKVAKAPKETTTTNALENITFPNCQVEITITDGKLTFLKAHNSSPITKQSRQSIISICKSSNGVYGQNAYCEGTEAEVLDFISKLS